MIKGVVGAILLAAAVSPNGQTTVDAVNQVGPEAVATADAAPANGKIIIYRPSSIMGMGIACPVRFKGHELVELGRGKFAEWEVPAGRYILNNKTSSVEVTVDAGGSSYVRCTIKPGFMTGRADLQIVDQESFAEHQADFERKEIAVPSGS